MIRRVSEAVWTGNRYESADYNVCTCDSCGEELTSYYAPLHSEETYCKMCFLQQFECIIIGENDEMYCDECFFGIEEGGKMYKDSLGRWLCEDCILYKHHHIEI